MRKKLGLFWFAAALLGAALIFSGCPTEAETETVTVTKGIAADVDALQELLEEGVTPIRYIGNLVLNGDTVVIPEGITVNVDGEVRLTGTNNVLGVAGGLTLGVERITGTGVVAGGQAVLDLIEDASITQAKVYSSIAEVTAALGTGNAAIVDVKASELSTTSIPDNILYVLGNLTYDSTTAIATTGVVKAYGKLVIAADATLPASTTLDPTNATITTSDGTTARTLTLPSGGAAVKAVNAAASLTFSGTEPFTVAGDAYFGGAASFAGAATFGGDATFGGNAAFTGVATFNGEAEFAGTATFTTTATFDELAVFGDDVTLTADGATFGETAFFAHGTTITLTDASSSITLGPHAGLAVGAPAANTPDVYDTVIRNSNGTTELTLEPAAGTVLTFDADGKGITQSGTIKIGGTDAALIPGATYTVASEATLEIDTSATLTLAAGVLTEEEGYFEDHPPGFDSKLVLTGAASDGATLTATGDLIAGATTITGGWQAVDADTAPGTVTIEENEITASNATAVLTGDTDGIINVTAGTLTVVGTIDITTAGTVTLTGDDTTAGSLLLKGGTIPGLLVVDSSEDTGVGLGSSLSATNFFLTDSSDTTAKKATVTKDGTDPAAAVTLTGADADATSGIVLGSIGGGTASPANDALITGQTAAANASAISNGWKVTAPNS